MFSRLARQRCVSLALAAPALLGACGDPNELEARYTVVTDTLMAFAVNGSPASYPSALNTGSRRVVRADGLLNFDVVFDLDAQGRTLVIPLRNVAGSFTPRTVGVQRISVPFDQLGRAPSGGYYADSTFALEPGQGVVMQVDSDVCDFEFSPFLYSKIVVDSVRVASRQIFFRMTHDPNCGFRSFEPGIPSS